MQQIAEWLEKLGMSEYAQRFAENDINFSILSDLTDQDLKEIGVSLGHRRQLLRAIVEPTGREKDAPKAAVATAPSAAPHLVGVAERVRPPMGGIGRLGRQMPRSRVWRSR